jgi:hypothetical protein
MHTPVELLQSACLLPQLLTQLSPYKTVEVSDKVAEQRFQSQVQSVPLTEETPLIYFHSITA